MASEESQNPKSPKICEKDDRIGWESLPKDLLVSIYSRLKIEELVVGSPFSCRSWHAASLDRSLYKVLDLRYWGRIYRRIMLVSPTKRPIEFGDLLKILVLRAGDAIEYMWFPDFVVRDSDILFFADRCPNLKFFYLRRTTTKSKEAICNAIRKWKKLEGIDVDEFILSRGMLEEIRSSCNNFINLRVSRKLAHYDAVNIVRCLPKLKSVDLSFAKVTYDTLLVILKGCKELESLDITGCGRVGVHPEVQKFAAGLNNFKFDKWLFLKRFRYWRLIRRLSDEISLQGTHTQTQLRLIMSLALGRVHYARVLMLHK